MSVSGLISPNNKSWSNLHINSLKVYNDLEVDGSIINNGSISNNTQNEAIEAIGLKEIKTDGAILGLLVETNELIVNGTVASPLTLINQTAEPYAIYVDYDKPIQTLGDIICRDVQASGDIQANSIIFDLNGQSLEQYDYHDDVVTFNAVDNPVNVDVDVNYSASIIGKDGNDAIVNVVFNFDNTHFEASGTGTLNSTPIEAEFRPLAGNTCKVLTVVTDQTGRNLALAELKSDGELYIYNDIDEAFYPTGAF